MILISAMSTNHVIGAGDGMPWNVPEEYQQFLELVAGQTILMGRRSYEIFGADLTTDHTVVLTSSPERVADDVSTAASLDEAIALARSFGKQVFCGGGAKVYEQALPLAEQMWLSYIHGDYQGDAYFPHFDPTDWRVVHEREHADFRFVRYQRIQP